MHKRQAWKAVSAVLACAVVAGATGCATTSDRTKTVGQTAGLGAVLGAVAGAVIGNQSDNPAQGAVIGAIAGGLLGTAAGVHVANRKAQFAKQEDYLDACIAQANKVYTEAIAYNDKASGEVAKLEIRANELLAQIEQRRELRRQAPALRKSIEAQRKEINGQIARINGEIQIQNEVLAQEKKGPAAGQIAALGNKIRDLERARDQLGQQSQRLAAMSNRMAI